MADDRSQATEVVDDHPEYLVAAAFIGGFALAQILKRLGQ